eukprot:557773-Pleurochrysis_carterae.AAC.9
MTHRTNRYTSRDLCAAVKPSLLTAILLLLSRARARRPLRLSARALTDIVGYRDPLPQTTPRPWRLAYPRRSREQVPQGIGPAGWADPILPPNTARRTVPLRPVRPSTLSGPSQRLAKTASKGMVGGENCSLAGSLDIVRVQKARAPRARARECYVPMCRYVACMFSLKVGGLCPQVDVCWTDHQREQARYRAQHPRPPPLMSAHCSAHVHCPAGVRAHPHALHHAARVHCRPARAPHPT